MPRVRALDRLCLLPVLLVALHVGGLRCASGPPNEASTDLRWPVAGHVSSEFGASRGHRRHRGIDIRAAAGSEVRAAGPGRVIASRFMRGYGNAVFIEHRGGLETRYAHNRENLVRRGQRVGRGDVIAKVGQTGNATAPHVHFEVRWRGEAQDPEDWLPKR